jgi:hypothetical protein
MFIRYLVSLTQVVNDLGYIIGVSAENLLFLTTYYSLFIPEAVGATQKFLHDVNIDNLSSLGTYYIYTTRFSFSLYKTLSGFGTTCFS